MGTKETKMLFAIVIYFPFSGITCFFSEHFAGNESDLRFEF